MALRLSLTSLFAVVLLLGISHACYYDYYNEPPADFDYRRCQVGCNQDAGLQPGRDNMYDTCCKVLSSGKFPEATCTALASQYQAKVTTSCPWGPVPTHDMPTTFVQPPPRPTPTPTSLPGTLIPCNTAWVTVTASPDCPGAPRPSTTSVVNAVPTTSSETLITSQSTTPTTDVPPPSSTAVITSSTTTPPVTRASTTTTSSSIVTPPPPPPTTKPKLPPITTTPCETDKQHPPAPTNTCACETQKAGSLPERGINRRNYGAHNCPCPPAGGNGHHRRGFAEERNTPAESPTTTSLVNSNSTSSASVECVTTMTTTITPSCPAATPAQPTTSTVNGVPTTSTTAVTPAPTTTPPSVTPAPTTTPPAITPAPTTSVKGPKPDEDCDEYGNPKDHGHPDKAGKLDRATNASGEGRR